ncbi:Sec-independent protein translocase protein TatB [Jeongeupia sp. USM3]|uniref:Sec-independent protein translocase protein TatB n=1 Tax=Jeongeupia sp. USM3 TaxID=1906741 RepID=UPI00089DE29B|nr:Sec-independent protein translocase protein TatB [Jeongeupia sp. USM3]AOY01254.1 twin arginine-targeting protein translocase TatB [Jeongeupia sp. USM3]
MFDVSLGELAIIGAVALVVIGPERLPTVARTVGALIGRAQRFVTSVKADLEREVRSSELAQIEAELRAEGEQLRQTIHAPVAELRETLADARGMLSEPAAGAVTADPAAEPVPEGAEAPSPEPVRDERQPDLFLADPAPLPARDRR